MDAKQKYDAKQKRRKQNRALKQHGIESLALGAHTTAPSKVIKGAQIGALQKRAELDMRLRCGLGEAVLAGVPGAAKAKAKLNDTWTKRYSKRLTGFWNPQA